jgi:hypothetical protein
MVMRKLIFFLSLLIPVPGFAQQYSINWHKVAGGGGTSSGTNGASVYSVSGTAGQPDAGGAMTGGGYSLTGGFWSFIALIQTPGAPTLTISESANSVIVSWPNTPNFTLQQSGNLAASPVWAPSGFTVATNASGTNSVTITTPTGNLFFRLANP